MIAFADGIWMSAIQGRFTGAAGNILLLHAFGFHALQAIPVVAWLFSRSRVPERVARVWVHAAGMACVAACLAIAWHPAAGLPLSEPSLPILTALGVLVAERRARPPGMARVSPGPGPVASCSSVLAHSVVPLDATDVDQVQPPQLNQHGLGG